MSITDSRPLREAIRRTLAHRAGAGADATGVMDATFATWQLMTDRLIPVIGAKGVDVLLERALHLTGRSHTWLAQAEEDVGDSARVFANLKLGLTGHDVRSVAQASQALLVTFTQLLASLIGESLTERLLLPVWVPGPPTSERGNAA